MDRHYRAGSEKDGANVYCVRIAEFCNYEGAINGVQGGIVLLRVSRLMNQVGSKLGCYR